MRSSPVRSPAGVLSLVALTLCLALIPVGSAGAVTNTNLVGDEDNFGFGATFSPNPPCSGFGNASGVDIIGGVRVFDSVREFFIDRGPWTHASPLLVSATSAQLQVREVYTDGNLGNPPEAMITIDGRTQFFEINGSSNCGPPKVQTFNIPLADLADGQVVVTVHQNADLFALDWSKLVFETPSQFSCTRRGTPGPDTMIGSPGPDVLCGLGGNDTLYGRGNGDRLLGGDDDDQLFGEDGHDKLFGGNGNDYAEGGIGSDRFEGFNGNDTLIGGLGNDYVFGQNGQDRLEGNEGNDALTGGADLDTCVQGPGSGPTVDCEG